MISIINGGQKSEREHKFHHYGIVIELMAQFFTCPGPVLYNFIILSALVLWLALPTRILDMTQAWHCFCPLPYHEMDMPRQVCRKMNKWSSEKLPVVPLSDQPNARHVSMPS
jgi:hypothetical protein